jgi:hypothetical protein
MKSTQPVRAIGAAPQNDITRSTDALLNAFAERVAVHVLERIATAGGSSGAARAPADGQQLLDRSGIALALGVSVSTIDRLIAKGCPFIWVLDSKRFEFDKVKAWLYAKTG